MFLRAQISDNAYLVEPTWHRKEWTEICKEESRLHGLYRASESNPAIFIKTLIFFFFFLLQICLRIQIFLKFASTVWLTGGSLSLTDCPEQRRSTKDQTAVGVGFQTLVAATSCFKFQTPPNLI